MIHGNAVTLLAFIGMTKFSWNLHRQLTERVTLLERGHLKLLVALDALSKREWL